MNVKKYFIFVTILATIGHILYFGEFAKWCRTQRWCEPFASEISRYIMTPFVIYGTSFFIVFLSLLLASISIQKKWWKFARIYLPIALILIFLSPSQTGGMFSGGFGGGYDREGMIWFTAGLFTVLSLITIFRAWRKEKKLA